MFQLPKGGEPDNPLPVLANTSKGSMESWCEKRTQTPKYR